MDLLMALLKAGLAAVDAYQQHMTAVDSLRAQVNSEAKNNLSAVDTPATATPKGNVP